jgi:MTH538 TIR-like domain (DUF1863)
MPGRKVFFSFNYEADIWRAAAVRNAGKIDATARAGWSDSSIWEKAKKKGDAEVIRIIEEALHGTSVTAVLIGADTANRPWVNFEIQKSIDRGNGLLGIRIDRLRDQDKKTSRRGKVPKLLSESGARIYEWKPKKFGRWVEFAAIDAGKFCVRHKRQACVSCRWFWWVYE